MPPAFSPRSCRAARAGESGFVFGQLHGVARLGAGLDLGTGLGEGGAAFLAAGDLGGDAQPVLQRRGVGLLGLGQELLHLGFEQGDRFAGARAAHGAVFAGVGEDLGAVGGDGELAELEHLELLGQLQHLDETLVEQRLVLAAEGAARVVIRMRVGGEQRTGTRSWVLCSRRRLEKVPVA